MGQKSLWIFAPRSKTDKRWEQNQHYALLRSQQLLRAKALRVEGPSEISRNSPKIKKQFSEIPSYFSELNGSVPTSFYSSNSSSSVNSGKSIVVTADWPICVKYAANSSTFSTGETAASIAIAKLSPATTRNCG